MRAFLNDRSLAGAAMTGFAIAAVLHGLYEIIVIMKPRSALPVAALLILAVWLWRLKLMHDLHKQASQGR